MKIKNDDLHNTTLTQSAQKEGYKISKEYYCGVTMKLSFFILTTAMVIISLGCSPRNGSSRRVFPDKYARALAEAAATGDTNAIDEALKMGGDVNYRGKDNVTPLAWSMAQGNRVGFEYLLKKGANPNARLDGRKSLLFWATEFEDTSFLSLALEYGGDPNQTTKLIVQENPLLWFAIVDNRPDVIKILLQHEADVNPKIIDSAAGMNGYHAVYLLLETGSSFTINRKPSSLLERLENRAVHPDDPEYIWRDKVVAFLRERGIEVTPKEWKREDQPTIINIQTKKSPKDRLKVLVP